MTETVEVVEEVDEEQQIQEEVRVASWSPVSLKF